ncbi:bifunctional serine/threonine-protein kinase/ABC transporter substrate-binding protein [Streptomyces cinnabarinus]|uniref:Bifunctional serine/threonine-protein kinase/ABC transporter substrate-binding protein n=1 Tax=Streptomyces cinnabarinus TaxID=67287 RepID=A0ABY7KNP8_9ACTN|nr:bifunctional serine/threonine-protein kinase/ABC transporter substrate-binding protein [Streptomyces cinnabarinus]WAZ26218.1 bifunctional serine/threonine-protein kinase/ABC transporter substrate-binding protein [Streptomyces cinnabarinus]
MSEPLRPTDPSRIAGFRLLRRLGAGGMGVVYLGRDDEGTLAAVKVIRGESTDDQAFRTRFGREAELARRVSSRWVVPVLGADAEAAEPWLATAFVPGPSLVEAVAEHGPLPAATTRSLVRRLAEALTDLHAAGLVHRDVKPGNVLLALDGPRLIDFGVARSEDDTALTASGMVVGSPGFLSPEQARGGTATAASDVFSLGGVLAYALTGRPPFGSGAPEALLYRTVHDEPDLDGIDDDSRPLVARCLAKEPEDRPTAGELRTLLAEDEPDGTVQLPDPVARMIAARSAEGLALPEIEPTRLDEPTAAPLQDTPPEDRRPSRRRLLLAGGALLLAASGGTAAALLATRDEDKEPAAARPVYVLGVHATEDTALVSRVSERAARLAVAQHNAVRNRAYDLKVRVLRDPGDAAGAQDVAGRFTADRDVVAVLGPVAELPMRSAAKIYGQAGLAHVSSTTGQQDYFVTSPKASFQTGPAHLAIGGWIMLHAMLTNQLGRIGVVLDRSGGTTIQDQAGLLVQQWRERGAEVVPQVVAEETGDGPDAVRALLAAEVAAFAYFGPLDATVTAARQLAAAGFEGPRWMQHLLYGTDFAERAGAAGEGWYVVNAAGDPSALTTKAARDFTAAWRKRYGAAPEPYAMEAYDSVRLLLGEFARTVPARSGTQPVRAALGKRLAKVNYQGIDRTYTFGEYHNYPLTGEGWLSSTYVHEVRNGRFRQVGSLADLQNAVNAES